MLLPQYTVSGLDDSDISAIQVEHKIQSSDGPLNLKLTMVMAGPFMLYLVQEWHQLRISSPLHEQLMHSVYNAGAKNAWNLAQYMGA